jgi:hypothetical protein
VEDVAIELLATRRLGQVAAELVLANDDRVYNAHALVRAALAAIPHAVDGCPGCAGHEYRIIAAEVEKLIERADDAAEDAEHQHPAGVH